MISMARTRRRRVKLMADYGAFPLWWLNRRGGGPGIHPDALPLSPELKMRLLAWAAVYDQLMQTDYEWPNDQALAAFVRQGWALLAELREELGPGYEVWYFNESTSQLER